MTEETLKQIESRWTRRNNTGAGWNEFNANAGEDVRVLLEEVRRFREEARWIPVGGSLPGLEVKVLVYEECYGTMIATLIHREGTEWDDWYEGSDHVSPSHWRPLPAPPAIEPLENFKELGTERKTR
jgi:Protein of unknown function (DUF551)